MKSNEVLGKLGILLLLLFQLNITSAQCPGWQMLSKKLATIEALESITDVPTLYSKELQGYEQIIAECYSRNDSIPVLFLQWMAKLYYRANDNIHAISKIKTAINTPELSTQYPALQIKNYYLLFLFYSKLKQNISQMTAIDSCIAISIASNLVNAYTLDAIQERVSYSYNKGDYLRALESATLGEQLTNKYNNIDKNEYSNLFSAWSINVLLRMKDFDRVIPLLQQKIKSNVNNPTVLGTYYEQLAQAAFEKADITLAQTSFHQAFQHDLSSQNFLGCAEILNNIGYYIHNRHYHNYDSSLFYYNKALSFFEKIPQKTMMLQFEKMNIYGNIATIYSHKKNFSNAFQYFKKAFDQLKPGLTDSALFQSKWLESSNARYLSLLLIKKSETYIQKYKVYHQREDIIEALRVCRVTDQLLDKIKDGQSENESKLLWRKDTRSLYEHAIEASLLANEPQQAFYFFEKSRAVLLSDQLNEQQLLKEEDILQLAQLKKNILDLQRQAESGSLNTAGRQVLNQKIYSSKQQLEQLDKQLKNNTPLYYQRIFDTSAVSIHALQKQLKRNDQSLLELFAGDQNAYALLVTGDSIYLKPVDKPAFEKHVQEYMAWLSNPAAINNWFNEFIHCSAALQQIIFSDLPAIGSRLVISTDGIHFPFEGLVTDTSNHLPAYLLNDHAVSYTYSARFFMNEFNSSISTNNNFWGMAPVSFPSGWSLAALQGSDVSLKKITGYFSNASGAIAANASRANFLQNYSKYNIIQLYTHAASTSIHNEPVIYFSDSALYLSDLINQNKPATRLVVLSACETGNGKDYTGEGVFSFNRAFAALGIPSAVANLWSVDNNTTYQITELFYKYLSQGLPTDIALQKAKLEFLKTASRQHSLPYYWAAPVLVGKPEIIAVNNQASFPWLIASGALAIGILVFVGYRNNPFSGPRHHKHRFTNRPVAGA